MEPIHFITLLESPIESYYAYYQFKATIFRTTEGKLEQKTGTEFCHLAPPGPPVSTCLTRCEAILYLPDEMRSYLDSA